MQEKLNYIWLGIFFIKTAMDSPSETECYGIPVAYYDGIKVTREKYNVVNVVKRKLMCINEEIDYFIEIITKIVQQILDDGGFEKQICYRIKIISCEIYIHNIMWNNVDDYPQQIIILEDEIKKMSI